VAFPAIRKLHIAGQLDRDAEAPFMPIYTSLRILTLDIELPDNVLQPIIRAHPELEQLGIFTNSHGGVPSAIREGYLQHLQNLDIATFKSMLNHQSIIYTTAWVVEAVSPTCNFRLFGRRLVLEDLCAALTTVKAVKTSIKFNPIVDSFEDPYDRFPYARFLFLSVQSCPSS
jgi:hypothetical protein